MCAKVLLLLESHEAIFWRFVKIVLILLGNDLICVSLDMAKFFALPAGMSFSFIKFDTLKSLIDETMGPLCKLLQAQSLPMSSCAG